MIDQLDTLELQELNILLEELSTRQKHASNTYVPDDNPKRNQLGFHKSNHWCRLVFGGNRSGKSRAAAQEIFWWFSNTHPYLRTPVKPRIWVLSAEYRTIFEGIWSHLKNVIAPWTIEKIGPRIPGWDVPSYVESKSGARIDFISAQGGEETRRKVQAAEIDLLSIDEEIGGELWTELQMRLLTRGGKVVISATLVESEEWLIDLQNEAESTIIAEADKQVAIFRLNTELNQYNDKTLLKRILSTLSADEAHVRIHGFSRRSSGLMYNTWEPKVHEIDPFIIPQHWTKVMCFDPGYRIVAALWVAIDPHDKAFAYREMYLANSTLQEAVKFIKAAEGLKFNPDNRLWENPDATAEEIHLRLIDPSAFRHLEDGSLGVGYQLANDYDLLFTPACNDKRTNVEDVRRWLLPDALNIPGFRAFRTLESFKMERSKYKINPDKSKRDKDSPVDRPLKKFDHLMNCWEYIASSRVNFQRATTPQERFEKIARLPDHEVDYPEHSSSNYTMFRAQLLRKRRELERNAQQGQGE